MDTHSKLENPYGLKAPVVKLERCDKIWKTLQLIRSMQDKHLEDIQDWIKREPIACEKYFTTQPPMTYIPDKSLPLNLIGEPDLPKPYIKYQPIFNNVDESLPQFQLAEKSRVNLYHCEICSQEYCNYKRFTDHQEQVHGISIPKRMVVKREKAQNKINSDLKNRRHATDINNHIKLNDKLVSDENIDLQTLVKNSSPQADSVRCKLCSKYFKNIKKHMIDYHKIRCIGVLSKVTDQNSNLHQEHSLVVLEPTDYTLPEYLEQNAEQTELVTSQDVHFSIQNTTNVSKRKLSMPSVGPRKRFRSMNSQEEEADTGIKQQLKCDICGKEYAHYKALCKHRDRHKNPNEDKQPSETKKSRNESVDPASRSKTNLEMSVKSTRDKDKDNSDISNKIPRTRSSFTKERRSSDALENENVLSLEKREEKHLEIKCTCGRTFRTTSILSNHKLACKFVNDTNTSKSPDARTGSDRDLGISITIKKKNNSYEIVSKDCSDEEPLKNGAIIEEEEMCEETSDSSSDNSDSTEFDDQLENLVPEKSKYSEDHRILKLKLAEEDVDIDIEEENDIVSKNSPNTVARNIGSNISTVNEQQVPLLRLLCKKFLIKQGLMPKEETSHQCETCGIYIGSKERLSKHVEKHRKAMKRSCSCDIKFTCMKTFDDHIEAVHPKSVTCPYCHEKYRSIVGLGEHLCVVDRGSPYVETFDENHPCPNCNIAFNNITWLHSHMRSKHLDKNLPFQCYQCLAKFPNELERGLHAQKEHNHGLACSVCNAKFQSAKTKQKHEAYHRGVGFPCHKCKKTYRSKKNRIHHVRTVHSDYSNDKLKCFICQKSIKAKSIRKHIHRHNSILKCEMCDKVVYDIRNLESHITDCHGNENYPRKKCKTCGVSFPTEELLQLHITVERYAKNGHCENV